MFGIWDNYYVDNNDEIREHCHITGKYRESAQRDCNTNLKLSHKIPIVFYNLKNYNAHFIMEELGKFNLEINLIPNRLLESYMSYNFIIR